MKRLLAALLTACILSLSLTAALSEAAEKVPREDRLSITQHIAII